MKHTTFLSGQTYHTRPRYGLRKLSIGLVSCMLGCTMVAAPIIASQSAHADTPQGGVALTSDPSSTALASPANVVEWEGIKLPKEVGVGAKRIDQKVTKDEISAKFKKAIKALNTGISEDEITVNISDAAVKKYNDNTVGAYRNIGYISLSNSTITYKGKTSREIPAKILAYALPFWAGHGGTDQILESNSIHNINKITVTDPNNYTLNAEQKQKIKDAFVKINSESKIRNDQNFKIVADKVSVDAQGNITYDDPVVGKTVISSEYTVSAIPPIKDIILWSNANTSEKIPEDAPITYKLKEGQTYSGFHLIQNPVNQDPSGTIEGKGFGLNAELKDGVIKFTGQLSFNKPADAFTKLVKLFRNTSNHLYREVSNTIVVRTMSYKTPETIYQDVKKLVSKDDLLKQLEVKDVGTVGADGNKQKKAQEIKDATTKTIEDGEFGKVGQDVGTYYTAKGYMTNPCGYKSPEIEMKVLYYTSDIPKTVVAKPNNLTPEEIAVIKKKVAGANKIGEDQVDVSTDGKVTLKYEKDNGGNYKKKIELKDAVVTAELHPSYDEETAKPSEVKKLPLKLPNGEQWPAGTTFRLPTAAQHYQVDKNTGEITVTVPADAAHNSSVEGSIIATFPDGLQRNVHFKVKVEKEGVANIIYIDEKDQDADVPATLDAFKAESDDAKYPKTLSGKIGNSVPLDHFDQNSAPKFVGYKFKKLAMKGGNTKFAETAQATLRVVYTKEPEIVTGITDPSKAPAGYVALTFKASKNSKINNGTQDVVVYVNPKAGVKFSADGTQLIGKDAQSQPLKVDVPKVTADEGYHVQFAKAGENQTSTWPYNNYDKTAETISAPLTFESQVATDENKQAEPSYAKVVVDPSKPAESTPTLYKTDKDGNLLGKDGAPIKKDGQNVTNPEDVADKSKLDTLDKAPQGSKWEKDPDQQIQAPQTLTPEDLAKITVDEQTGKVTLPKEVAEKLKPGEKVIVPVKVTYPDKSVDKGNAEFAAPQNIAGDPSYPATEVKTGEDTTSDPSLYKTDKDGNLLDTDGNQLKDKDGQPTKDPEKVADKDKLVKVDVPANSKWEIDKDKQIEAPDTLTPEDLAKITVDPATGKVTLPKEVAAKLKPGEKITVPIKITYPDGTSDTTTATFKVPVSTGGVPVPPGGASSDVVPNPNPSENGNAPHGGNADEQGSNGAGDTSQTQGQAGSSSDTGTASVARRPHRAGRIAQTSDSLNASAGLLTSLASLAGVVLVKKCKH